MLVAALTHKGASGVQGASFIALVATLMVIPSIPVAGMAIILGVDRFMSMCRATVNVISNGVATLVVARWDKELDAETLRANLAAVTGEGHDGESGAAGLTAQVDRLPIDEGFQSAFAVLRQAGARLLDAAERHRRFLVAGVHIDMRQTGFDAVDVVLRRPEV